MVYSCVLVAGLALGVEGFGQLPSFPGSWVAADVDHESVAGLAVG
jgi:hypothetical protein